jgi:hypothetical protein
LRRRKKKDWDAAFQRVLRNPVTHPVGIDEIIEEVKRERLERWEQGTGA